MGEGRAGVGDADETRAGVEGARAPEGARPEPALARFLARHATSPRAAVERDVAELRALDPAASWRVVDAVCRSAADVLSMRPDRAALVSEREPPHPSFAEVVRRLARGYAYGRA